jgi:tetratricopeptide (TPR) repeat protein
MPRILIPSGGVLASETDVKSRAFAAIAVAVLLGPVLAGAQVQAPTLVEGELPAEEPRAKQGRAGEPVPEPLQPPEPLPPPPAARPEPQPAAAGTVPGVSISPEELRRLQRPIQPVHVTPAVIDQTWQTRRRAGREQDAATRRAAGDAMRDAMRELGILSLPAHAVAEVREAERALDARAVEDAVEHAAFATALAPGLPETHVALARARFAAEPFRPLPALRSAGAGLLAAARDPHVARAMLGDMAGAAVVALFGAAAATLALLFLSRLRLFLHDFRHLPVVRSGTPGQATALALALLALPFVFRLGPFAVLLAAALAAWPWLGRGERLAATASLLALVAIPWLAGHAATATAWQGTLADEVYEIETAWPPPAAIEALRSRAAREKLPAPALLAIGRWHKRQGQLDEARRWYDEALASDPRSAEARVNLGNVLFLQGDLEGAKAAYLEAVDRTRELSTLAAAQYDLAKLYLRLAAVAQSTEARRKAQQADAAYLARLGSDDDFRANAWLVDALPTVERLAELAARDPMPAAVQAAALRRVAGPLVRWGWPALPLALVASLWVITLAVPRLSPSSACDRCGRPACRRCDPGATTSCGQCVNVFLRQNAVDPRDRIRKEEQVLRHERARRLAGRALAVATGGAGHVVGGRPVVGFLVMFALLFLGFVVWFWHGVVPPPQHSPYAAALRLAVAVPLFAVLYGIAVRDAFRRTRPD